MNKVELEIRENTEIKNSSVNYFEANVLFSKKFIGFKGHFPNNPILPGICIVKAQIVALEKLLGKSCLLKKMISVKFYLPVVPGSYLKYDTKLERNANEPSIMLRSKVTCNGKRTAQLKLLLESQQMME